MDFIYAISFFYFAGGGEQIFIHGKSESILKFLLGAISFYVPNFQTVQVYLKTTGYSENFEHTLTLLCFY